MSWLCDHMDYSPPGFSCPRIVQARTLEWIPFPSPGVLPNPGTEPRYPTLQADSSLSETPGKPKPSQKFSVFNTRCLAAANEIITLFLKILFFFALQDTLITLFFFPLESLWLLLFHYHHFKFWCYLRVHFGSLLASYSLSFHALTQSTFLHGKTHKFISSDFISPLNTWLIFNYQFNIFNWLS